MNALLFFKLKTNTKPFALLYGFLFLLIFSCNNQKSPDAEKLEPVKEETAQEQIKKAPVDTATMLNNLQGNWREAEYPFRTAEFTNTRVKFIEEGVEQAPAFEDFSLSNQCPYTVNNIKGAAPASVFLVLPKFKRCEIISVQNDTLTLSGFNTNTRSNYEIVYLKIK